MGIPIGCGSLAVLALLLSGLLSGVFTAGRTVQARQDRREQGDLRAEVAALRDDLSDVQDRQDAQAAAKRAPVDPAARPFDLHVAADLRQNGAGER